MSNILWLLYLADVMTSLVPVLCISALVLLFGLVLLSTMEAEEAPHGQECRTFIKLIRVRLLIPAAMVFVACLMPSKQLLYIAVGLNVGETVVNTEIGQKSVRALEAWLDKAIDSATPAK